MKKLIASLLLLAACDVRAHTDSSSSHTIDASADASVEVAIEKAVSPIATIQIPRHILIVGDSEACAVSRYVKQTVKKINEDAGQPLDVVDVECKGGTQVRYWGEQGHIAEALNKHPHPDYVIVFLGTNHYMQSKAPDVSIVLDKIADARAQCIWVGNTAVNGKKWKINAAMNVAVIQSCMYFDTEAANIQLGDGVHPTGSGAIKWIKLIWDTIPVMRVAQKEDDNNHDN